MKSDTSADITVVSFKWKPTNPLYRNKFGPEQPNRLQAMFARHLRLKHRFVCVTDDDTGLDCETFPLWHDLAKVPNPHGLREPSCYRRLKLFDPEVYRHLGDRILWCDLDMVLTGDVTPLFDRPESIVLLGTDVANIPVNGSLVLFTPSENEDLWSDFDPAVSPRLARQAGCWGSDQGWLGYKRPNAAKWKAGPGGDGIYFFGQHMRQKGSPARLPDDARMVSFHGRGNPWGAFESGLPWVQKHYGGCDARRAA